MYLRLALLTVWLALVTVRLRVRLTLAVAVWVAERAVGVLDIFLVVVFGLDDDVVDLVVVVVVLGGLGLAVVVLVLGLVEEEVVVVLGLEAVVLLTGCGVVLLVTRLLVVRARVWTERPWEEMKLPVVSPTLPTAVRTCRWMEGMSPSFGILTLNYAALRIC